MNFFLFGFVFIVEVGEVQRLQSKPRVGKENIFRAESVSIVKVNKIHKSEWDSDVDANLGSKIGVRIGRHVWHISQKNFLFWSQTLIQCRMDSEIRIGDDCYGSKRLKVWAEI